MKNNFLNDEHRAASIEKDFRVIKIVDKYRVVVNKGYSQGLKKEDSLEIFTSGELIIDPITMEELGSLDTIKAKVEVEVLYPNMAICRSDEWDIKEKKVNSLYAFAPKIEKTETRRTLSIDDSQVEDLLSDKIIKVGDFLRFERE